MFPPQPGFTNEPTDIRFALARAYRGVDRLDDAAVELRELIASGRNRSDRPIEYVRSFYLLGQLAEQQGQREEARRNYRRFVDYWADGDLDRDEIAHAQSFLRSS